MRIRDVMTPAADIVTIGPDAPVSRAVHLLMTHSIGALPVMGDERSPLGLIAERDVVRALHVHEGHIMDLPVQRVMRSPPPLCDVDDPVNRIMARMTRERTRHLLVREEAHLVGIVSVGDLLKQRLRDLELEAGVLRDYVSAQRSRR